MLSTRAIFVLITVGLFTWVPARAHAQTPTECGIGWRISGGNECRWEGARGHIEVGLRNATTIYFDLLVDGKATQETYADLLTENYRIDVRRVSNRSVIGGGTALLQREGYVLTFVDHLLSVNVAATTSELRIRYGGDGLLAVESLANLGER